MYQPNAIDVLLRSQQQAKLFNSQMMQCLPAAQFSAMPQMTANVASRQLGNANGLQVPTCLGQTNQQVAGAQVAFDPQAIAFRLPKINDVINTR
jgi:hypothetical protein